jgi:hypothetical protein
LQDVSGVLAGTVWTKAVNHNKSANWLPESTLTGGVMRHDEFSSRLA